MHTNVQLPKNVHKKFKGESYKTPPLVRATGLEYTIEHPASSRRMATVHRTVAFTWVRVRCYFRCGRQDSSTLWSTRRRAAGWQQSTGLLHLHGFESVAYTKIKKEPAGSFFILVRATGLEPAQLSQRNLNPPSLPIPPRPRVACNRVILSWEPGNVNGRQPEPLKFPGGKGQFSQFLLSLSLTFRQDACKIT